MIHFYRALGLSKCCIPAGKTAAPVPPRRSLLSSSAGTAGTTRPTRPPTGHLSSLLARVAAGNLSPDKAASQLAPLLVSGGAQAEDVGGFAKIDHDRQRRVGFPEVIFGDGKSADQIIDILTAMIREARQEANSEKAAGGPRAAEGHPIIGDSPIVATRVSPEKWCLISKGLPGQLTYHADARIVSFGAPPALSAAGGMRTAGISAVDTDSAGTTGAAAGKGGRGGVTSIGKVAVLSAGTSDLPVAEEAAVLAELAGAEVSRFHDVGVAGIHRLLAAVPAVEKVGVAICVAGMDGAMPGVVAGLVKCPVVAVPTSVGYGAAMSGLAPLLTMLNACAPGVSVVNIDNGFGAAAFAVKLLKSSKIIAAEADE